MNNWQARCTEPIDARLPLSSPDESSDDDNHIMEEASDEEHAPAPISRFTMEQAQAHFDHIMMEVELEAQVAQPVVSAFWMLQEEQRYNLRLL